MSKQGNDELRRYHDARNELIRAFTAKIDFAHDNEIAYRRKQPALRLN